MRLLAALSAAGVSSEKQEPRCGGPLFPGIAPLVRRGNACCDPVLWQQPGHDKECNRKIVHNFAELERHTRDCCEASGSKPLAGRLPDMRRYAQRQATRGDAGAAVLVRLADMVLLDFWWFCVPQNMSAGLENESFLRERLQAVIQAEVGIPFINKLGWGGRRIEVVSVLETRLRPLLHNCWEAVEPCGPRFACMMDGCDTYTNGEYECPLNAEGFGSNVCYFGLTPQRWYCPVSAPLAILAPPKVASTSISEWAARLDGSVWSAATRVRAVAFGPNCTSDGPTSSSCVSGVTRAIGSSLERFSSCNKGHSRKLARRITDTLSLSDGHVAHVRGPLCHTCCARALGRTRVVLVRNPFARVGSFYLYNWHGLERSSFKRFLQYATFDTRLCDPRDSGGNCSGRSAFGRNDRLHVRPIAHTLADLLPPEAGIDDTLVVLHLETLTEQTFVALSDRLCVRHGYCEPLKMLPHRNRLSEASRPSKREHVPWDAASLSKVITWHKQDFQCFGYGEDPSQPDPVMPLPKRCGPFRLVSL